MNFNLQEHPTLVPSPPREEAQPQPPTSRVSSPPTHHEPAPQSEPMADEQEERQPEEHTNAAQEQAEGAEPEPRQQPATRRASRKLPQVVMDDEQIMIPGNIYQMWIQDASSIISKRPRKPKPQHPIATTKISILMDLPPLALMTGMDNFPSELHYPAPLLKLWRKCTGATPARGSSSGFSPAEKFPQAGFAPYQNLSYEWNPAGSGIMMNHYNFPVFLLSEESTSMVREIPKTGKGKKAAREKIGLIGY